MKTIGGFIGLEMQIGDQPYHRYAIAMSTGRACLSLILQELKPKKIYLPAYTCDALLEPLLERKICWEYYGLDEQFDPIFEGKLNMGEYILYINYFGLKRVTVKRFSAKYGQRLIVDNTQAFFEKSVKGWAFNSARKFFGVPDGAYLYGSRTVAKVPVRNTRVRCGHLLDRLLEKKNAYEDFLKYEQELDSRIESMSIISQQMLGGVDYTKVSLRRSRNFNYLDKQFRGINLFDVPALGGQVPLCYPLLLAHKINRDKLSRQGIFIPTYWKRRVDLRTHGFKWVENLAERLLPLPIDQRYQLTDLDRMIKSITKLVHSN